MTSRDYEGLAEKLDIWPSPKTGADYSVNSIKEQMTEAAAAIRHLIAERDRLEESAEGLEADLMSAVQVAWRRGAKEWATLNYPGWVDWLKSCDAINEARIVSGRPRAALSGRKEP